MCSSSAASTSATCARCCRRRASRISIPADALSRLEALPEFTESPDFQKLAVAFKRVKNIARELPDADRGRKSTIRRSRRC